MGPCDQFVACEHCGAQGPTGKNAANSSSKWKERIMRTLIIAALLGVLPGLSRAETVNTYFPNVSLELDFLANATNQYLGTLTKSAFFANTYSFSVTRKNPAYQPPAPPLDPNRIVNEFIANSTYTYVYGWANGMENERAKNLRSISDFSVQCSSPGFYGVTGAWDVRVCTTTLANIHQYIYDQSFSTPTVIPGF
jgi:hypothetical protein